MTTRLRGINYRVLTVMTLVAVPVMLIGAFFAIEEAHGRLKEAFGLSLAQRAEQSAAAIDTYVYRRIVDVSMLARVPDVRAEAALANGRPFDEAAATDLDRRWPTLDGRSPAVAAILATAASRYFADITRQDPIYREILLTDREGRLIAASNVTSDYYQADEDWWKRVMGDRGRGEANISDVRWDESARTHAMEIAVPVPVEGEATPAGVLKVVADIREMLANVASIQLDTDGDAMLLRRNGTVVFSRHTVDPSARFFAADRLRERMEAISGEAPSRFSFTATSSDGDEFIVGVATSQLSTTYPHLPWVVAAWQSERALLAPVESQYRSLLLVTALTVLSMLAIAFWFSLRLAAPQVDVDMHLVEHPKIHRVAEEESEERV